MHSHLLLVTVFLSIHLHIGIAMLGRSLPCRAAAGSWLPRLRASRRNHKTKKPVQSRVARRCTTCAEPSHWKSFKCVGSNPEKYAEVRAKTEGGDCEIPRVGEFRNKTVIGNAAAGYHAHFFGLPEAEERAVPRTNRRSPNFDLFPLARNRKFAHFAVNIAGSIAADLVHRLTPGLSHLGVPSSSR